MQGHHPKPRPWLADRQAVARLAVIEVVKLKREIERIEAWLRRHEVAYGMPVDEYPTRMRGAVRRWKWNRSFEGSTR